MLVSYIGAFGNRRFHVRALLLSLHVPVPALDDDMHSPVQPCDVPILANGLFYVIMNVCNSCASVCLAVLAAVAHVSSPDPTAQHKRPMMHSALWYIARPA